MKMYYTYGVFCFYDIITAILLSRRFDMDYSQTLLYKYYITNSKYFLDDKLKEILNCVSFIESSQFIYYSNGQS